MIEDDVRRLGRPSGDERMALAVAQGAPTGSAGAIAAAVEPVVASLPRGEARPSVGIEPASFLVALRSARP